MSWTGSDGDQTFNQTLHQLYNASLDNIKFVAESEWNATKVKVTKGLCRVFEGYPYQELKIELSKSGERFDVTVSDPETEVDFLPPIHMTGDKIAEDSSPPGSKRFIVYKVNG